LFTQVDEHVVALVEERLPVMMNRDNQEAAAAAATVSDDQPRVLLEHLFGQVAGCFPRRDPPGRQSDGSQAADGA
jgi:hypothetical protein